MRRIAEREEWLEALTAAGVRRDLERVVALLRAPHVVVRMAAVRALSRAAVAADIFRRAIRRERNWLVLSELLEAIGYVGDQRDVPALRSRAQRDRSPLVRAEAARALAQVGGSAQREFLEKLERKEKNPRVLVNVYEALYELGSSEALRRLTDLLGNGNFYVRCATAHTLASLHLGRQKPNVRASLLKALGGETRKGARSSLRYALKRIA